MFFLRYNGKIRGPFAEDRLQQLLTEGRVPYTAEVSPDRFNWGPLHIQPPVLPVPAAAMSFIPPIPAAVDYGAPPLPPQLVEVLPATVAPEEDFVVHLDPTAPATAQHHTTTAPPPPEPPTAAGDQGDMFGDLDWSKFSGDV